MRRSYFLHLSFMVAVPSAIKVFNWTATLYKGSITFEAPMLFALGFIVLFTFGGMAGLFLATLGIDMHVHDTYFVIAHFHFIMVGGMVTAYMAGLHYWWPKMTGRMYSEWWSRLVRNHHLRGVFPHVFAAIRVGLQRHAAPLPHICSRISGVECAFHGRVIDSRRGLFVAFVLLPVFITPRC